MIDTKKEHIAVTEANRLQHPGRRGRRHQLRPRRHRLRDPRQRRRDPFRAAHVPRDRRRGDRGPRDRAAPQRARPAPAPRTRAGRGRGRAAPAAHAGGRSAFQEQQAEARGRRGRAAARDRGARPAGEGGRRPRRRTGRLAERPTRPTAATDRDGRRRDRRTLPTPRPKPTGVNKAMADISAKDVAALRKMTGAGMMDCKKALAETDGDIDAAKDWLREKGIAGAAKRAGREADQGAIEVLVDGNVARARRAQLRDRLRRQGRRVQAAPSAALTQARRSSEGDDRPRRRRPSTARPVDDFVKGLSGTLGEKIELGRVVRFETRRRPARRLQARPERARHRRRARRAGRRRPDERQGARGRARHRAAHRQRGAPLRVAATTCPADEVERERAILEAQTTRRGQARAGVAQDRRGQAQRLLQDGRARRAVVREGQQADDRRARRRRSAAAQACAASPASRSARSRRCPQHARSGAADDREPVPPSGAQALG